MIVTSSYREALAALLPGGAMSAYQPSSLSPATYYVGDVNEIGDGSEYLARLRTERAIKMGESE
jgi:hypothetical protein